MLVALCYAELGSMFRQNGGPYVYAKEAFGPAAGFGVGWLSWVSSVFSWAAVANAVSSSLAYFHPWFDRAGAEKSVAALLILGFGLVNYRGIKLGAWTVDFFTLAKLVPLFLFAAIGLFFIAPANYRPFWHAGTGSFGYAVFLSLWTLQGFEVTPFPSGESLEPQKAVPIAAVGSLVCATLIYVLVQSVAVGVYPGLANAGTKPLADAAARFMGAAGGTLMALGAAVSMVGSNAGDALGCPRLLSALAQDRHLPPCLATPHPRFNTPSAAILITGGLTAAAAWFLSFDCLVDLATLAVISQYVATCSAVVWLRRRRPDAPRLFRIPAGLPVALAGCAVSLWLVRQVKLPELLLAGLVLALGFACTAGFRLATRNKKPATFSC
ncbi:putative fructoselysine transporter FrlA [Verrucomicrobia bacterium]|nr:putative fructoselysine transporter FrlA [Verrucomicrobiota bacterium]